MNQLLAVPLPGTLEDPRYPDSNGRFMGETDFHNVAMTLLKEALEDYFADQPDVYVASNLVFYWQEGDARRRRDPDVLVARGTAGKHKRRSYRLWEEKRLPCVLFEVASRRTWRNDVRQKPELYAGLGVKEYFIFDPEQRYLDPPLLGFRAVRRRPVPLKPAADGSLPSRELGLRLIPEGDSLRLASLATGELVMTRSERADHEQQLREQEHKQLEQERILREREHLRAEALAAEVERLRRQLERRP